LKVVQSRFIGAGIEIGDRFLKPALAGDRSHMKSHLAIRILTLAAIVYACVVLFADSALGQCVMCRASLGSNSTFIRNFNIGVFVLLVPPVSIFCTIFVIAIRHRKS
jgi:hypothetical protein